MTQSLVPKVKGYVGAVGRVSRGRTTGTEMGALTAAFLLNTCDWEYYLKTDINPNDRILNVSVFGSPAEENMVMDCFSWQR